MESNLSLTEDNMFLGESPEVLSPCSRRTFTDGVPTCGTIKLPMGAYCLHVFWSRPYRYKPFTTCGVAVKVAGLSYIDHASSVNCRKASVFLIDSPVRLNLKALCTNRSSIASAMVGSGNSSCQDE